MLHFIINPLFQLHYDGEPAPESVVDGQRAGKMTDDIEILSAKFCLYTTNDKLVVSLLKVN